MDMQIDILTLFPESVDAMLNVSILGRAQERGYIAIRTHQIRAYTTNKQMQVDDYPYGGGRGAVMQADPLFRCWEHVVNTYGPGRTIFMSPCGRTFTQSVARELKAATTRASTSGSSTRVWTRNCPWAISSSPAERSPPWR